MLNLYCVMTENCNLRCEHCYMWAGPGKKDTTVTSENFQRMLSHLPVTATDMALTGGEIFTVENQLNQYLDLIQKENEKRTAKDKIQIELQTNGFWLQKKDAQDILLRLKEKQIFALDITSDDKYHRKQGLNLSFDLIDMARRYIPEVRLRGSVEPYPVGRWTGMFPISEHRAEECRDNCGITSSISIKNTGKVYPCCFPFFEYPGNVFQESLRTILEKTLTNPRFIALKKNGLAGIAEYDGFNPKTVKNLIVRYGSCGACAQLYGRELI